MAGSPAHRLILASASPRRFELLRQIGVQATVQAADIDETPLSGEAPSDYVLRMARNKAHAVAAGADTHTVVLAADTTVVIDGDVLGKPVDYMDALAMLARLSGRTHEVMTAVCVVTEGRVEDIQVTTKVSFANLNRALCEAYLATDEPWDKAGAYGIQGMGAILVSAIEGSYSNVVGLPLSECWHLLSACGVQTGLQLLTAMTGDQE
ncbi:MAG: Maf family protein [Parahaliea sp.]